MKKGFTLLELLIVVGILSTLLVLGVTIYSFAQKKSRDAKRVADLEQIRVALESYRGDNDGTYPTTASWKSDLVSGNYMPQIPTDPRAGVYQYVYELSGVDYNLEAFLELGGSCTVTPLNCNVSGTAVSCNYCIGPYGKK